MRKPEKILFFVSIAALAGALVSAACLAYRFGIAERDRSFDCSLASDCVTVNSPSDAAGGSVSDSVSKPCLSLTIDFDALSERNSDIVGWIYQKDTPVSYPVVQGKDNSFWLDRRFDDSPDFGYSGTIFLDWRCEAHGGNNLILYGHNASRTDPVKFSSLIAYAEDPEYVKAHPSFEYYDAETGEGDVYDVFAVIEPDISTNEKADRYYRRCPDGDYAEYLKLLAGQTLYDTGIIPATDRRALLLSTCVTGHYDTRCIVCCIGRTPIRGK